MLSLQLHRLQKLIIQPHTSNARKKANHTILIIPFNNWFQEIDILLVKNLKNANNFKFHRRNGLNRKE